MPPSSRSKFNNWPAIVSKTLQMQSAYVAVGYPGDTTGADAHQAAAINLAALAAVHEYGSPSRNIPARPFMQKTAKRVSPRLALLVRVLWKKVSDGRMPSEMALKQIGIYYENEMKQSFRVETFERLADSTIEAKGSDRPLVDTAQLRNGITSTVRFSNVPAFARVSA